MIFDILTKVGAGIAKSYIAMFYTVLFYIVFFKKEPPRFAVGQRVIVNKTDLTNVLGTRLQHGEVIKLRRCFKYYWKYDILLDTGNYEKMVYEHNVEKMRDVDTSISITRDIDQLTKL